MFILFFNKGLCFTNKQKIIGNKLLMNSTLQKGINSEDFTICQKDKFALILVS